MPMEVKSCPKCGAMIVPQLTRCRQCKAYLQGTRVEGFLLESLLPEQLQHSPATATMIFAIFLYYALVVVVTLPVDASSIMGFSSFTLEQLGATHGPSILRGQWWRFVTSIFIHHDLLHLAFNIWSLVSVGQLVERIFDRKKMLLIYLGSGVASMVVSHLWYVELGRGLFVTSGGASGAVCGLIGAAWFGARKLGPQGTEIVAGMKRWALYLVVWGLFMPNINNAAHLGGFVVGALLAMATPAGLTQTVAMQRVLSVLALASLGVVVLSTGLMLANLRGYPTAFADDWESRGIFGMIYHPGVEPEQSSQVAAAQKCRVVSDTMHPSEDALKACELAVRANADDVEAYELAARLYDRHGQGDEAQALRDAVTSLMRKRRR